MKKESKFLLWFKRNLTVKMIAANALIAALYAVITVICGTLSYVGGSLQLRFSEILNLLVFFNPIYSIGLTIGCLIANLVSLYGIFDIVFGTLGTFISCLLIVLISKTIKNLLVSGLVPCIINALIVPLIVYLYTPTMEMNALIYLNFFGWTFLGEFICIMCVGYPIILVSSKKYKGFSQLINSTQNFTYKF